MRENMIKERYEMSKQIYGKLGVVTRSISS